MGLRTVKILTTDVPCGDDTITLRGISLSDVARLADTYGPQMMILFKKVQDGESLKSKDVRTIIGSLAQEMPDMAAAMIALASDDFDEETVEIAKKLPLPVQTECLEAIFVRTFTSEAAVKKLIESLTRMIAAASGTLTQVSWPLEIGTGVSGEVRPS